MTKQQTPIGSSRQESVGRWALWLVWTLVGLAAIFSSLHGDRSVSTSYYDAALRWMHQQPLYNQMGNDFIYFPQSAILYVPLSWLPFSVSEVVWRLLNYFLLYWGLVTCGECCTQGKLALKSQWLMSLIILPILFSSLRNGQMNVTVIVVALWLIFCVDQSRWKSAAVLMAIGLCFKPTFIVLFLLLWVLYPQLRVKSLVAVMIGFLFPWLVDWHWSYVGAQYHLAVMSLAQTAHVGESMALEWAQLFNVITQISGHPVSIKIQLIIRVCMALLTCLVAWRGYKKWQHLDSGRTLFFIYGLFAAYLMLFNPRTENNDYVILAVAIAFEWVFYSKSLGLKIVLPILALFILLGSNISQLIIPNNPSWVTPCVALVYFIFLLQRHCCRQTRP